MERGLEFLRHAGRRGGRGPDVALQERQPGLRTVRKLRRSFRDICLNPKSTLDDAHCRQLAIGAMYASQQGAWQNSLETGISDTLPEILDGWWGIDSTAEARTQLDYLCEKGFRYYWPTVLEAFQARRPSAAGCVVPAADDLAGGLRQATSQPRKLA